MTDSPADPPTIPSIESPEHLERPEVLDTSEVDGAERAIDETVDHPAKVMRIGTMMKQLLDEVRAASLDAPSRERLREIYDTSVAELGSALSPDLREELGRLTLSFSDHTPSSSEIQVAQAQLVGWLEGLVQGMQAMLFAQQMAAQQQLQNMRGQLGPGRPESMLPTGDERPGTYL